MDCTDNRSKKAIESAIERPTPLTVEADGIPSELRERSQWVGWRYERRKGTKWTKRPINVRSGRPASSTDRATWSTFADALAFSRRGGCDGIGFVFTADDPYAGVDLDDALTATGELEPWAAEIVQDLDSSYTEVSPSGTGVKIFVRGKLPEGRHRRGNVEMYDRGRYFALTGRRLPGTPAEIRERQQALEQVHARVIRQEKPPTGDEPRPGVGSLDLDDAELIEKAKTARNGAKFTVLFTGDTAAYSSASEAELALCSLLAFWTVRDADRMDRLFRQSGLFREKWNERRGAETYGAMTIAKAIASCTVAYGENQHSGRNGAAPKQKQAAHRYTVGDLTIRQELPRKTASGKLVVPLTIIRADKTIDLCNLSSSSSGRKEAIKIIGAHIAGDEGARRVLESLIPQIIVDAAAALCAKADRDAPTIRQIVQRRVPETMKLTHRTRSGAAWSEARGGELTRNDFTAILPGWLLDECSTAKDAPRNQSGEINRPGLLRALEAELRVLWSDLLSTLPVVTDADLGPNTEAGRRFVEATTKLWTRMLTLERSVDGAGDDKVIRRASIISRVRTQARPFLHDGKLPEKRERWREVQHGFAAWWRPQVLSDGEVGVLLGMRWELTGQIGQDLPGVHDQTSLTTLGERYGVLDREPPVATMLSGGRNRLAVLSLELTRDLLENPADMSDPDEYESTVDDDMLDSVTQ